MRDCLIDVENNGSNVQFFDAGGTLLETILLPDAGDNGVLEVDLRVAGVSRMNVNLTRSGGLAGLKWTSRGTGPGDAFRIAVPEPDVFVVDVETSDREDSEGDGLRDRITAGSDASRFLINESTGALFFASPPDQSQPADANGDNVYELEVAVTDSGGLSDQRRIAVTVTSGNADPSTLTANLLPLEELRQERGLRGTK